MGGWFFRKFLQVLVVLLICLAVAAVYVVFFVNPSHFTGQINKILQSHTGYELEVRGKVSWKFTPTFALHLQDVTLAGPKEFKSPFFVAKDIHVFMNFFSLFSSNLVINKLEVDQMVATVTRLESGNRNIDGLSSVKTNPEDHLVINEIVITNSTLLYANEQSKRHWALNNATISMRTMSFNPTTSFGSIKIKGDFTQLDHNITFNVETTLAIDTGKQTGTFDPTTIMWNGAKFDGDILIAGYPADPVYKANFILDSVDLSDLVNSINPDVAASDNDFGGKANGKISFSFNEQNKVLDVPEFEFTFGEGSMKGNTKVNFTPPYLFAFDVTLNKITLLPYAVAAKKIIPVMLSNMQVTNPVDMLKTIGIRGKIAGTDLKIRSDFVVDHLNADFAVDKGIVQFGPILLRALDGAHNFGVTIDLMKASPVIKLVEQGNNVQLEPWLQLFDLPKIVTGTAELKVALEGNGFNLESFAASATGGLDFNIKKGTLYSLDIDKLQAYALTSVTDVQAQLSANKATDLTKVINLKASDWASSQKNATGTMFESLQLKSDVKAGMTTSSLSMKSTAYDVSGNGSISLADAKLQMTMQISTKAPPPSVSAEIGKFMVQLPLDVKVTGTIVKPIYEPDLQTYISKIVNQSQKSLMSVAAAKMISATGQSAPTDKSAEAIFIDSLQGLKQ